MAEYGSTLRAPIERIAFVLTVLLVVGVEDEQHLERPLERRVRRVLRLGHPEHHREEVADVAEVVVRIDVRQPAAVPVRPRRRSSAPWRSAGRSVASRISGSSTCLASGRTSTARPQRADEHSHRMRVVAEASINFLMFSWRKVWCVMSSVQPASSALVGSSPCTSRYAVLQVRAFLGQLLDRVAAVAENAPVAVDEGDRAAHRSRVQEGGVVAHQAKVILSDLCLSERCGPDRSRLDRYLEGAPRPIIRDRERLSHRPTSLWH